MEEIIVGDKILGTHHNIFLNARVSTVVGNVFNIPLSIMLRISKSSVVRYPPYSHRANDVSKSFNSALLGSIRWFADIPR